MRRILLLFFVFLLAGVALALVFRENNGYVQIAYGSWRLETSLFFFVAAVVLALVVLVAAWRLLLAGIWLPARLRALAARRRQRKARKALDQGLLRLYEGRWGEAERELLRRAEQSENAGVNYLAAAHTAQQQNAVDRRDRYLELASGRRGASELAVLLTQAQLQIQQGQDAEALATLGRLRELEPDHPQVTLLLAEVGERLGEWGLLRELLPALRKGDCVPEGRWRALAMAAWADRIEQGPAEPAGLAARWREVPRTVRREPGLQQVYVARLRAAGAQAEAAALIRATLKNQWAPGLVVAFGDLVLDDQTEQLATVERWLKQYGGETELQLVAGRLCLRNRLWGRARSYFEATLHGVSPPEALLELGRLFEEIDQDSEALQAYRQGLEATVEKPL